MFLDALAFRPNTRAYKFTGITIIAPRMGNELNRFGTFYATSEVLKMNKKVIFYNKL